MTHHVVAEAHRNCLVQQARMRHGRRTSVSHVDLLHLPLFAAAAPTNHRVSFRPLNDPPTSFVCLLVSRSHGRQGRPIRRRCQVGSDSCRGHDSIGRRRGVLCVPRVGRRWRRVGHIRLQAPTGDGWLRSNAGPESWTGRGYAPVRRPPMTNLRRPPTSRSCVRPRGRR
jgi:hypothetical protein